MAHAPGNPINNQQARVPAKHSSFNLSYTLASTMRFGEITPHYVENTVPQDNVRLQCKNTLDTYTLKAPLKSNLKIHKEYFNVPMQAILPFQEDRVYQHPKNGDDVPSDAGCSVVDFDKKINDYFRGLDGMIYTSYIEPSLTPEIDSLLECSIRQFIQMEYFYSTGSLINYLGHSMWGRFRGFPAWKNFDMFFDNFWNDIFSVVERIGYTTGDETETQYAYFGELLDTGHQRATNRRTFIEQLRDNGGDFIIKSLTLVQGKSDEDLWDILTSYNSNESGNWELQEYNVKPYDLSRLFAYQIVCAHFFTEDKVDYVYSAELYRQNLCAILDGLFDYFNTSRAGFNADSFEWNGITLKYDYCSAANFNGVFSCVEGELDLGSSRLVGRYLSAIFAFRHSLKFKDYFTGCRTTPLAVGDTTVDVQSGNKVDIIDTIRVTAYTRFLNAVNRIGRKTSHYLEGLFPGLRVAYDYHDPSFIGETVDETFTDTTQNTGDAMLDEQMTIRANLKSASNRYAFEFNVDREGILIGLTWFDIPRLYTRSTDRVLMASDRFEKFNPMMEYIGDQPVYVAELTDDFRNQFDEDVDTFGYTQRYMEYKQRISRAVGGFVDNLPGYVFKADDAAGVPYKSHISPSYIRSSNVELDEFFVSLTGFSLGSYWHFITIHNNICDDAKRPMAHNPQLL